MKNTLNLKTLRKAACIFAVAGLFSCSTEEQLENVEQLDVETSALSGKKVKTTDKNCRKGFHEAQFYVPKGTDHNRLDSKNDKEVDDRSCHYNYTQKGTAGIYRLKAKTNHIDNNETRIERATKRAGKRKKGNGVTFSGYCTINRVGFQAKKHFNTRTKFSDNNGTYFIQAKGTHDHKTIGSKDPAILLLIAKPVYKKQKNQAPKFLHFEILSEQITKRGGESSDGRELVVLTTVKKGERFKVEMKNFFKTDKDQYVEIKVAGKTHNFKVPNTVATIKNKKTNKKEKKTQFGNQAKIRFGAYRCKYGEAEILWDTVKATIVNKQ